MQSAKDKLLEQYIRQLIPKNPKDLGESGKNTVKSILFRIKEISPDFQLFLVKSHLWTISYINNPTFEAVLCAIGKRLYLDNAGLEAIDRLSEEDCQKILDQLMVKDIIE
jgi:hypothetical protein